MQKRELICVVGARPNFMKIAPIMRAFEGAGFPLTPRLLHTGQHYDVAMNEQFFRQLDIPLPHLDLEVGSGTHAQQTAAIMQRFEPVLEASPVAAVLVVGDVNSTIACALVAVKRQVPVIHVEAGLRSGDRSMPEEINRVLTDQLSDLLFITERGARDNLLREGIAEDRIHFVGNVMIDTLIHNLPKAVLPQETLAELYANGRIGDEGYAVVTLHRPGNVDDPQTLAALMAAIDDIGGRIPVVFPVHPRTAARLDAAGLRDSFQHIHFLPPLGYLEMLGLNAGARLVLTDSGGIQEETTALGVPCLTLRPNTERPITIEQGTNTLVGTDPARVREIAMAKLAESDEDTKPGQGGKTRIPEGWDGHAAERIAGILAQWAEDLPVADDGQ
jgi:UDP-N-acetylglucosamine 2-epimerase (non-hydrolysing)